MMKKERMLIVLHSIFWDGMPTLIAKSSME